MLEDWHDAEQIRDEALELFSHGIVDLKTRAEIESMYWSVCHEINTLAKQMKHVPEELRGLDKILADKYFCNFSLFQSLPDSWAIDQLFPIMPIQRLDERPGRKDRKSTRLNSSHANISYAVFCLKKKKKHILTPSTHISI